MQQDHTSLAFCSSTMLRHNLHSHKHDPEKKWNQSGNFTSFISVLDNYKKGRFFFLILFLHSSVIQGTKSLLYKKIRYKNYSVILHTKKHPLTWRHLFEWSVLLRPDNILFNTRAILSKGYYLGLITSLICLFFAIE